MEELDKAINKFLYELTELCRRHGMYLDKDSYMEYGERYEYLKIEDFGSSGTEVYYYVDEEGSIHFDAPGRSLSSNACLGTNPPVDDVEAFRAAKNRMAALFNDRREENRKANLEAIKQYNEVMTSRWRKVASEAPRSKPACHCGAVFSTDAERDKHCQTTGHGPDPFGGQPASPPPAPQKPS